MRVLVWLSWWVDSAVVAYLLKQQGFDVVWWFMKNYVSDTWNCTTYDDAEEAIKVAKFLDIEIISFDMQKEYNEKIIKYIYDWYKKWMTPNPDVLCNSLIKFDVFLQKALDKWFDKIAMWHYARISYNEKLKVDNYKLLRGVDYTKDQSYFLAGLNQYQLSHSLFPLWNLKKSEVRKIAKEIWLPNADRPDSQWLCFIWNIPIRQFLEKQLPRKEWNIVLSDWTIVGKHQWAWFYTIGQRHGLWLNFQSYVIKTNVENNIIVVGEKSHEELSNNFIIALDWHWINQKYNLPLNVKIKIRYRQEPQLATLVKFEWNKLLISFDEPQRAIASGQVVVAYIDDECIGSGIIK